MKRLVDRLRLGGDLGPEDYAALLKGAAEGPLLAYAMQAAREVAVARFGTGIFIRGLIEITNYCRNAATTAAFAAATAGWNATGSPGKRYSHAAGRAIRWVSGRSYCREGKTPRSTTHG